ncbi:hypothetical protein CGLO_12886 [Colletotrichum gloeosporioides Cg-14]|uniref:Uncharacterized protein n=1 Tax=Colletotrichum gloeosporioides (strain Cg-14) TaxID=1237896 RepID=T0JXK8_COLGC|nr:hypothetical protein CGLO_12886 [Colletotrichum gloeosporioides Cg-14]
MAHYFFINKYFFHMLYAVMIINY